MSKTRLWLERIGVASIAVVALTAPFVFGLVYYLGVTDGIDINSGDPLRESRLWMVQEKRGPVGIALLLTMPIGEIQPGAQCARTQMTVLYWNRGLSLDNSARYCKCYERSAAGGLAESKVTC
jgi:hypothetical protein